MHSPNSRGASVLELSLVIFVLFVLFLGMADLARLLAAKMIATTSAQDGLQLAQRIPGLSIDLPNVCATYPRTGRSPAPVYPPGYSYVKCSQFDAARDDVNFAAERKAIATFLLPSGSGNETRLVPFRFPSKSSSEMLLRDSLLLLPGEYGKAQFSSGEQTFTNPLGRSLPTNLPWSEVLKKFPMTVHVCFEMTPILKPVFSNWKSCGMATGYRPSIADMVPGPISVSTFAVPTTSNSSTTTSSVTSTTSATPAAGSTTSTSRTTTSSSRTTTSRSTTTTVCPDPGCMPPRVVWDFSTCSCECPFSPCSSPAYVDGNTCDCVCPSWLPPCPDGSPRDPFAAPACECPTTTTSTSTTTTSESTTTTENVEPPGGGPPPCQTCRNYVCYYPNPNPADPPLSWDTCCIEGSTCPPTPPPGLDCDAFGGIMPNGMPYACCGCSGGACITSCGDGEPSKIGQPCNVNADCGTGFGVPCSSTAPCADWNRRARCDRSCA